MKIGFASVTFRPIKDLSRIVAIAVKTGVDCIEWGGDVHVTNEHEAQQAKALCEKAGIEIISYGSYYRVGSGNVEEWEKICKIAHTMGAKIVRVWLGKKGSADTDSVYYEKILNDLTSICNLAKKYSLVVAPECHTNTYNDNTDAFLKILAEVKEKSGCDNFKTYFQSKYVNLEYDFDRIERTVNEIEVVHVSYLDQIKEQASQKKDRKYIKKLLEKLKCEGYDKLVLIEFTHFSSPLFFMKDIAVLKKQIN